MSLIRNLWRTACTFVTRQGEECGSAYAGRWFQREVIEVATFRAAAAPPDDEPVNPELDLDAEQN